MLYLQKAVTLLAFAGIVPRVAGYEYNTAKVSTNLDEHTIEALRVLGKSPDQYRGPGSVPDARFPPGTHLLPQIKHIVFLMLENHSWDNMLGTLNRPDAEGFPIDRCTGKPAAWNKFANGTKLFAYEANQTCIRTPGSDAPTQNYQSSHLQYDNSSLDGFVTGGGFKPVAMAYHTKRQLPFFHALFSIFPIMDRYFCSVLGPTWPNRRYFMAATAAGVTATGQNLTGLPSNTTTIFAELTKYNVSWRSYVPGFETGAMASLNHDFPYPAENAAIKENGRPLEQFFVDAKNGNLSSFTFVDNNGTFNSGENPQNVVHMEALIASVVQAIGASPNWNSTLLLINFDEHGGYYDHIPPPVAIVPDNIAPVPPAGVPDYDSYHRYGFRVPAVVVSAYAKKNFVSHRVYDHTSALATIERVWNIPALTRRDANAHDLLETIDLDALLLGQPTFPSLTAMNLPHSGDTPEGVACDSNTFLLDVPATAIGGAFPTDCAVPFYADRNIF